MMNATFMRVTVSLLLGTAMAAGSDAIVLDGLRHDDVHIIESGAGYYVHFPETGEVTPLPRDTVGPEDVVISGDAQARAKTLDRWRQRRLQKPPSPAEPLGAAAAPAPPPGSLRWGPLYDLRSGIRERSVSVDEQGTPVLVLKGTDYKEPLREAYVAERQLAQMEERRVRAEQEAREQRAYELEMARIQGETASAAYAAEAEANRWPRAAYPQYYVPVYPSHWRRHRRHSGVDPGFGVPPPGNPGGATTTSTQVLSHGGDYSGWSHGRDYSGWSHGRDRVSE